MTCSPAVLWAFCYAGLVCGALITLALLWFVTFVKRL